jgi:hypothetical protein
MLTAYLDLRSADPPHGRQLVLHQQMICFIVESPLTNDQIRAGILDSLDHIRELIRLVFPKLLVLLDAGNVQLVFGFGARRLERTCQDGKAGVFDGMWHLRVRHVLVYQNAFDESGVSERPPDFPLDLDEIKKDVPPFEISNLKHGIDSNLSKLPMLLRHAERVVDVRDPNEGQLHATNILLPRLVMAVLRRLSVLSLENSTRSEIRLSSSTAIVHARSNPSAIRIGWIPRSRSASLCSSNAPARTGHAHVRTFKIEMHARHETHRRHQSSRPRFRHLDFLTVARAV